MSDPLLTGLEEEYQILSELYRSAGAVTYLARNMHTRDVTITVIPAAARGGPGALMRIASDARLLTHLRHANVVPMIDGRWRGRNAFILIHARVRGSTLEQLINEIGPISLIRARATLEQVKMALDWARSHSVAFRRVTPESLTFQQGSGRALVSFDSPPTGSPRPPAGAPPEFEDVRTIGRLARIMISGMLDAGDNETPLTLLKPEISSRLGLATDALARGEWENENDIPAFMNLLSDTVGRSVNDPALRPGSPSIAMPVVDDKPRRPTNYVNPVTRIEEESIPSTAEHAVYEASSDIAADADIEPDTEVPSEAGVEAQAQIAEPAPAVEPPTSPTQVRESIALWEIASEPMRESAAAAASPDASVDASIDANADGGNGEANSSGNTADEFPDDEETESGHRTTAPRRKVEPATLLPRTITPVDAKTVPAVPMQRVQKTEEIAARGGTPKPAPSPVPPEPEHIVTQTVHRVVPPVVAPDTDEEVTPPTAEHPVVSHAPIEQAPSAVAIEQSASPVSIEQSPPVAMGQQSASPLGIEKAPTASAMESHPSPVVMPAVKAPPPMVIETSASPATIEPPPSSPPPSVQAPAAAHPPVKTPPQPNVRITPPRGSQSMAAMDEARSGIASPPRSAPVVPSAPASLPPPPPPERPLMEEMMPAMPSSTPSAPAPSRPAPPPRATTPPRPGPSTTATPPRPGPVATGTPPRPGPLPPAPGRSPRTPAAPRPPKPPPDPYEEPISTPARAQAAARPRPVVKKSRLPMIGATVAILAAAGIGTFMFLKQRGPTEPPVSTAPAPDSTPAPTAPPSAKKGSPGAPAVAVATPAAIEATNTPGCRSTAAEDQQKCFTDALDKIDNGVSVVYESLIAALRKQAHTPTGATDPPSVDSVQSTQRTWTDRRARACEAVASGMYPGRDRAGCFADFSTKRIKELQQRLSTVPSGD